MALPVVYFQASATVIPTLLIAVAVGGKLGDRLGRGLTSWGVALMIVFSVAVFSAEVVALLAIAKGYGAFWEGVVALIAIVLCLYCVMLLFLDEARSQSRGARVERALDALLMILVVAVLAVGISGLLNISRQ